jgi:hypothetical protein
MSQAVCLTWVRAYLKLANHVVPEPPFQVAGTLFEVLRRQVETNFRRRDCVEVQGVYDRYCVKKEKLDSYYVPIDKIQTALRELESELDAKDFAALCSNENYIDGVNWENFQDLLRRPRRLGEWAKSLHLHEIVADAFPRKAGVDPLRVASELSPDELIAVINALRYGFEQIIRTSLTELKKAFHVNDQKLNDGDSKFNVVAISCGDISDFHKGVVARIGIFACTLVLLVFPSY